jgi:hypothetical protein
MRNYIVCFIWTLIYLPCFSAPDNMYIEQSSAVDSAIEKLSEAEVFEKFSHPDPSAVKDSISSQKKYAFESSIEEGRCKMKLICYKCCVGEGPEKECSEKFDNWKNGENCACP